MRGAESDGGRSCRVVHVTSAHVTFDTRIFHKECRSLVDAGFEVTLVAPAAERQTVDGVRIVPLQKPSSRIDRFLNQPRRIASVLRELDPDILHFHDPELLPIGAKEARRGRRVIYDSHEMLPSLVRGRQWIPAPLRRPAALLAHVAERILVRDLAAIVSAEPAGASRFRGSHVTVVRNLPLLREWTTIPSARDRSNTVLYVGDITEARGASVMVDAMQVVGASHRARLVLAGKVAPALLAELERRPGWRHVDFVGWLDRDAVVRAMTSASVALAVFQPNEQYSSATEPVKLYEYLAAGLCVVASDFPRFRSIAEQSAAAVFVDPTSVDDVATAIRTTLEDPDRGTRGARGREYILERFSWESEAVALISLYEELSSPS